jgi:hypothetical protein
MTRSFVLPCCLALATLGTSTRAAAQAPGYPAPDANPGAPMRDVPIDDPALSPAERIHSHPYVVSLGARAMWIRNSGFDVFNENDNLTAFTLGVGRSLFAQGNLSFAVMAFWDAGGVESDVRGESTELFVHRISLGPELRWHPLSDGYAFLRASPAVLNAIASLKESVTGSTYYARSDDVDLGVFSSWDFGIDLTAGVAYELFGSAGRHAGPVRFWLSGEGGYAWSSATPLDFSPEADDAAAPERVAVLDQGELAVRGPFLRVVAAATF